ncbi:MAG: HaeII family restriction endonuclease [Anaerolineae bacterium]|nr:HaeII family restriction endonuclease [Anaerolineae bacterium]
MNANLIAAKNALDRIIRKGRAHLYKPIHIAEVLYYSRNGVARVNVSQLDTYRTISKRWRDDVSRRLVGRRSTSTAKYQDDIFNDSAMPPQLLAILDEENKRQDGVVEVYIYHKIRQRLQDVADAYNYLEQSTVDTFSLKAFLDYFEKRPGLKRSVDKAYEIVVYALFSTLVDELKATVSLTLDNPDPGVLEDFSLFAEYVLGVNQSKTVIVKPARIYRGGVANAADRGLDMWANFGPAVQVKHLRLDAELADEIAEEVATDDIVIVCKTAEATLIQSLLNQIGKPIRGIITQDNLLDWYALCLTKYQSRMGDKILRHLRNEFTQEFPSLEGMPSFLNERGYTVTKLTDDWQL